MLNKYGVCKTDEKKAQLLTAISRLKVNEDFQRLLAFLEDVQKAIDRGNRSASTPNLEWGQGKAQLLDQQLNLISDAERQRDLIKQKG